MIKNDFEFKIAFYLFVLDSYGLIGTDYNKLESMLKDYLMYTGYNHIRDLDLLINYFREKGEI